MGFALFLAQPFQHLFPLLRKDPETDQSQHNAQNNSSDPSIKHKRPCGHGFLHPLYCASQPPSSTCCQVLSKSCISASVTFPDTCC